MTDLEPIPGISIVCVFNNIDVRRNCLDRSIEAYDGPVSVEYIPVNNTANGFRSAGAALNYGASQARHEVLVFVHQDVYLHSLDRIAQAAAHILGDRWGVLGANGVTNDGKSVGRIRDRVQLIGQDAPYPHEVDSLDEVLFMVRRDRILRYPLTEDPDLSWHAYAVEYGLRLRSQGLLVGAVDLAITHNSLTINLDKLDVAHRRVALLYPESLPVATTCGRIGHSAQRWRSVGVLRDHGWRLRWLRESRVARQFYRQLPVPVVLADIRHDVDLLDYSDSAPLYLFNLDYAGGFAEYESNPLHLLRRDRPIICCSSRNCRELVSELDNVPSSASWLVTDIELGDLHFFRNRSDLESCVAGVARTGIWLAGGHITRHLPAQWRDTRALPPRSLVPARTATFQA